MKKHETLVYSVVGLAALFLILVAFNFLASLAPGRIDLTQGSIYTLSEGTKKILRGLDAPVKLKQLPLKYNGQTTLEFEVPAGGTEAADFDLKVP